MYTNGIGGEEIMEVNAAEFRANCFKMLDQVTLTHREVIITKRGKPVAKLVHFAQQNDKDPLLGSMEGMVETIGNLTEPVIEHEAWELD
jgi:prevent-host-death family protein